jgi:microcystin-dependent protein
MAAGESIEASCLPSNTTIVSITNSSTVVVSQAATAGGTVTATVFPWGNGDGSTTFNVPDLRGRMLAGVDNMGGSAANRVTSAVSGITGTTLGATGGDQHAQQDTLTVVDPGHLHTANQLFQGIGSTAGPNNSAVNFFSTSTGSTNTATTGITVTSGLTGASQNMPPTAMINYIIYAGA